jgi:hypothetical protein
MGMPAKAPVVSPCYLRAKEGKELKGALSNDNK